MAAVAVTGTSCKTMRGKGACAPVDCGGKQVCVEVPCREVHCPPGTVWSPRCKKRIEATIAATKSLHSRPDVEVVRVAELKKTPAPALNPEPVAEPMPQIPDPAPLPEPEKMVVKAPPTVVEEVTDRAIVLEVENASKIIHADGKDLVIEGNDSVIVVSGGCSVLTVKGQRNQVQVDFVEQVRIEGDVNTLVVGTFGSGQINGNGNIVSWGEGMDGNIPIAQANGKDNSVARLE